jgi:hypothetical protein
MGVGTALNRNPSKDLPAHNLRASVRIAMYFNAIGVWKGCRPSPSANGPQNILLYGEPNEKNYEKAGNHYQRHIVFQFRVASSAPVAILRDFEQFRHSQDYVMRELFRAAPVVPERMRVRL